MLTPVKLLGGPPPTTEASVYTVPTSPTPQKLILKQVVISNTINASAWVSISLVPAGSSSGTANRLLNQYAIPAFTIHTIDLSLVLNPGDFVSWVQGTTSAVNLFMSGILVI